MEKVKCGSIEERSGKEKKWPWRNVVVSIDKFVVYNGDEVKKMRGNLSLVATVIATMAFQAALNPPGSFIQQNIRPSEGTLTASNNTSLDEGPLACLPYRDEFGFNGSSGACPGQAMLAYVYPERFQRFIAYNAVSFVASMIVVLLLVSGVALTSRTLLRFLSLGMIAAVLSLLNAYIIGLVLINPSSKSIHRVVNWTTWIFMAFYFLVLIILFIASVTTPNEELTKPHESSDQGEGTMEPANNA